MRVIEADLLDRRDLEKFIQVPEQFYRGNPYYVQPLIREQRRFFHPNNPHFAYTDARYYLLQDKNGRVRGRISAHTDRRHLEREQEKVGYFGFFECPPDQEAANALLEIAEQDLVARGMSAIQGPYNFSINEQCGFLAQGFDQAPALMMPYTQPAYPALVGSAGYQCFRRLFAYEFDHVGLNAERIERIRERVTKRKGVSIRSVDPKKFESEVVSLYSLYCHVWEEALGYVPMTEEIFRQHAEELRVVADPNLVLLAEKEGSPIAFSFTLPDHNAIIKKMRGRIWPFGWIWLLAHRYLVRRARTVMLGVKSEYRAIGLDTLLIFETLKRCVARGYRSGEASWIQEENLAMRRPIERAGGRVSKIYQLYEKQLRTTINPC
ncbi:MAG TPA: hypothetical protein PKD64_15805 [Pirellulaceae bacterium]|nr:hypothetical protein [Pirellulaceae bacterium]HMO93652.1 hypothetical protein [Pirellulaceae bacterium]HMP70656.1 hypothetical protein [Pirellulaceae bacterium]